MITQKFFGVLGLGASGRSVVNFFQKHKFNFIAWDNNICLENTSDSFIKSPQDKDWRKIDFLVKSPGIKITVDNKIIKIALENNIKIISDIELLYQLNPKAKYIGITGTNGKSTTTHLLRHIFSEAGLNFACGGNIGTAVMDLQQNNSEDFTYLLEVSSYQLHSIDQMRFNLAVILNITKDHLDWHQNMDNYVSAKMNIIKNSKEGDILLYKGDDPIIQKKIGQTYYQSTLVPFYSSKANGDNYIINDSIHSEEGNINLPTNNHLLGKHNRENILAAYLISKKMCISDTLFKNAIKSFVGLKHRNQFVKKIKNVTFINDSKSTNFESCDKSLETNKEPIILLMGGMYKEGSDFSIIKKHAKKIIAVFCFGESKDIFKKELDSIDIFNKPFNDLEMAFKEALIESQKHPENLAILLSPGCASFDQWRNFEERGDAFINLVKDL